MLNKCVKSKVKRDGGSFTYNGAGDPHRTNNILTKEK